ncbi:glycoside hydrolase family 43 protein [Kribbella speibonae]|uniref:Glycoside hydrolase family 43 protein n=1 Tax=Kribbella speibonae TaxID=1572660 RepID=A0A4R0IRQ3_9ACTN|nr:glycoside hydrolase family 43 protein [Kribbella speibonae]TCC36481.1 glycoside hydrolase family 43 protein [Kribbella speibonae]
MSDTAQPDTGNAATVPIIPGFYPDPTICRVGQDYYLAHSSFEYFPGAPIWHSTNLRDWTQIGHIFTRRSQFARGDARPSTGLYAGTLRHHDGRFWYVTTNASDYDRGQILVHAQDPAGPWSEPVRVPDAIGIDPDIAWDALGHCYLTWKAMSFTDGEVGILQSRLDVKTGHIETPWPVWQGSGLGAVESPHLYHVENTWYLVLAEGGTERGHTATVAKSPQPWGPFEDCPHNPVLTHRSTIHPTQNIGHADLVRTPTGGWAAVYLGARPRGSTPGFHVLGRETFLAGIDWNDGWPVFAEDRYQVAPVLTEFDDHFDEPVLHMRWLVPGSEPVTTTDLLPDGGIRILPRSPGSGGSAGLLCTRLRDLRWTAEATIEGNGGFQLRLDHRHHYQLTVVDGTVRASATIGDIDVVLATAPAPDGPTVLRLAAQDPAEANVPLGDAGPDTIVLSLVEPDGPRELARLDGRYLSTEVASGFTGRMLALTATNSPAVVRRMTYRPDH